MTDLGSNRRTRKPANSGRVTYCTPQPILDGLRRFGPIACDPCWHATSRVEADICYTIEDNGLAQAWPLDGTTYVNPPYGAALRREWVPKILHEAARGVEIISLVPASTETYAFREQLEACDVCMLVTSRLKFDGETDSAFFASALFYYGPMPRSFECAFQPIAYRIVGG